MQKGLGRGLDALFGGAVKKDEEIAPLKLPIAEIMPNPSQPRRIFVEEGMRELANSIQEQGVLQPILVRPADGGKYQIIAGERRWRAANMAGLNLVPVIVREMDDSEAMAVALIENLQREDLNPLEEAKALAALKETLNLSQDELAEKVGKSRSAVANAVRLLQLSPGAQDDIVNGRLTAGHARCLLSIDNPEKGEALRLRIAELGLTVRECEKAAAFYKENGLFEWEKKEFKAEVKKKTKSEDSESFRNLEDSMAQKLGCAVRISGNEKKGKISVSYKSNDELQTILQKLGLA